jgi:transposase-like protein
MTDMSDKLTNESKALNPCPNCGNNMAVAVVGYSTRRFKIYGFACDHCRIEYNPLTGVYATAKQKLVVEK